jgi:DNA/RNA-binding domain of Phe-tRNA-synthetase-like protein
MIPISIDSELKKSVKDIYLGVVTARVKVNQFDSGLWDEIDRHVNSLDRDLTLERLSDVKEIKAAREAYRTLGKDPNRYRGSAEALFRRILQGKGLYKVNTVVDINNLISLEMRHPVGSYDLANIKPPVLFRVGWNGEAYKGIGKDVINIAGLPIFADSLGAFGSPTSDSERAMIRLQTTDLMMAVICFCGLDGLESALNMISARLQRYAFAEKDSIERTIIH